MKIQKLKVLRKKLILSSCVAWVAFVASSQEQADVGAEVVIKETGMMALVTQNIDFGLFTFTSSASGGSVGMNLHTGELPPAGNRSEYLHGGTSHYGLVHYTMPAGSYTISCTTDVYLALAGNSDLSTRISMAGVYYGHIVGGTNVDAQWCFQGPIEFQSTGAPRTFNVAGIINLPPGASAIAGSYNTSNPNGKPITFTFTAI